MQSYGSPGRRVAIIAGVRTPFAKSGSTLKGISAIELGKHCVAELIQRTEIDGKLALADTVGQHMPELESSPIGAVRLLDLATHTAGGFPLQLPDEVKTGVQLMAWYRAWKPKFAAGTMRSSSSASRSTTSKTCSVARLHRCYRKSKTSSRRRPAKRFSAAILGPTWPKWKTGSTRHSTPDR